MATATTALLLLLLSLSTFTVAQSFPPIERYQPLTDVTNVAKFDLNLEAMMDQLSSSSFGSAANEYVSGLPENDTISLKTLSSTLSTGCSLSLDDLSSSSPSAIEIYQQYYGSTTRNDDLITAALSGSGPYFSNSRGKFTTSENDALRARFVVAGLRYTTVVYSFLCEISKAVDTCLPGVPVVPGDIDRAWARYVGSLATGGGGGGGGGGVSFYSLMGQRCSEMQTCSSITTGTARVNERVLSRMVAAQSARTRGDCLTLSETRDELLTEFTIGLVQSLIKYAYLASQTPLTSQVVGDWAEAWGVAQALLPRLAACDASVAAMVVSNLDPSQASLLPMQDGFLKFIYALQTTFSCLEVKCSWVGSLQSSVINYVQCSDGDQLWSPAAGFWNGEVPPRGIFAGYEFRSDVRNHAGIDGDVASLTAFAGQSRFADCAVSYATGRYSPLPDGSMRSLKDMATGEAIVGDSLLSLTNPTSNDDATVTSVTYAAAFYNSSSFPDVLISGAISGSGALLFASLASGISTTTAASDEFRARLIQDAPVLLVSWIHIARYLEFARYATCGGVDNSTYSPSPLTAGSGEYRINPFDAAVAFFTGARVNESIPSSGYMLYTRSNALCSTFSTCATSSVSTSNQRLVNYFSAGQRAFSAGSCEEVKVAIHAATAEMLVPLIQGLFLALNELAEATTHAANGGNPVTSPTAAVRSAWAKAYVYTVGVLPRVEACSVALGTMLRRWIMGFPNVFESSPAGSDPLPLEGEPENAKVLMSALLSSLECLHLACSWVGTPIFDPTLTCFNQYDAAASLLMSSSDSDGIPVCPPSFSPSDSSGTGSLDGGAVAGIVVAVVASFVWGVRIAYRAGVRNGARSVQTVELDPHHHHDVKRNVQGDGGNQADENIREEIEFV